MVQGMTSMVILSESHIAFHTWPENGFVACDIFTCGTNALPEKGLEIICDYFKPVTMYVNVIGRG
ncbi:MAG: adenosylmethionine decarboxylase [Candidatus Chromulinivorax sp.]|nr:adenosylmethionine decarboxylase [Candidatus Chromulinivorax sp.]